MEELFSKFADAHNKLLDIQIKCQKAAFNYISKVLDNEIDHKIEFDDDLGEIVSVVYDGGRHPEYASNAFSYVISVYKDANGNVYVETEDDDMPINNLMTNEICDIALTIKEHIDYFANVVSKNMKECLDKATED